MRRFPFYAALALLSLGNAQAIGVRVLLDQGKTQVGLACQGPLKILDGEGKVLGLPGHSTSATVAPRAQGGLQVGMLPAGQALSASCPDGKIRYANTLWRGRMLVLSSGGTLQVINQVEMEDYLKSVVASEMPATWPAEALEAQAVAARSYVLHAMTQKAQVAWDMGAGSARPKQGMSTASFPIPDVPSDHILLEPGKGVFNPAALINQSGQPFDLRRGQEDQVYKGVAAEDPRATQAVLATKSKLMVFQNRFVRALFHANSGGLTADSTGIWHDNLPYLRPVLSPDEDQPGGTWKLELSNEDIERALIDNGIPVRDLRAILPLTKDASGRHLSLAMVDKYGVHTLSAFDFRKALGMDKMKSTFFQMQYAGREGPVVREDDLQGYLYGETMLEDVRRYVILGKGYGHGAGMSQYGALSMARAGKSFQQILKHYYQGIDIVNLSDLGLE